MPFVRIAEEQCIGCGNCLASCAFNAIALRDGDSPRAFILDTCTVCGACLDACPYAAIEMVKEERTFADISAYQGIWVFCEQFRAQVRPVALELLGEGRRLADQLGTRLTGVLLGQGITQEAEKLIAYGADRVLLVDEAYLAELHDLNYTGVMVELAQTYKPGIILLGATSFGRSFAPRVAARLKTGLTADCTMLAVDQEQGLLLQTRPAFGGNVMATIITPHHRPQMATVRPKVFAPPPPDPSRRGEIIRVQVGQPEATGVKLMELIKGRGDEANIGDADIIVAVGRGIGNARNIALAEELARLVGGAVAVSRPLVDSGWYGYRHQVGQTGKTVAPKVYIACGISGAVQHLAGIAAETVVAVNSDPEAPIFSYAHYAIHGDCLEFLESMIEAVKAGGVHGV